MRTACRLGSRAKIDREWRSVARASVSSRQGKAPVNRQPLRARVCEGRQKEVD